MKIKPIVYLILAVIGLLGTWYFNIQFAIQGHSFAHFIPQAFSTAAGGSLSVDILIAATAGSIWMIIESRRLKIKYIWLYIVLSFTVAFAFAFPLFLYVRERRLLNIELI